MKSLIKSEQLLQKAEEEEKKMIYQNLVEET